MVSVAGCLAWLVCRYRSRIKAIFDDRITRCFLMACVWANPALNIWTSGAKPSNALVKMSATLLAFGSLVCIIKGIEESVKRLRAGRAHGAVSPVTPPAP